MRKIFSLIILALLCEASLVEQFKKAGYVEIYDQKSPEAFDALYTCFDEFIEFLQTNPAWGQKICIVKERFIRSKDRDYYSTDVFGFYDESKRKGRSQISFYYSIHFHDFICSHYPELNQIPEVIHFLEACHKIQKPYGQLFEKTAAELGLETIFSSTYGQPPILFKVIKYFPDYVATKPHYDGAVFSLFLDSTDNQSLLLSSYQPSFTTDDFSVPLRKFPRKDSILLIPGALLAEFSIYPTPHIALQNGKIRYATIAFSMRPHYTPQKIELSPLPVFRD